MQPQQHQSLQVIRLAFVQLVVAQLLALLQQDQVQLLLVKKVMLQPGQQEHQQRLNQQLGELQQVQQAHLKVLVEVAAVVSITQSSSPV
jgi:hypothetical protein